MGETRLGPKKTKIVATIGPASESPEIISKLIKSGVNVFRFNMKHNNISWHEKTILKVQEEADKLQTNVGILIDLQGPEIRIKTLNEKDVKVKKGQALNFSTNFDTEVDLQSNTNPIHIAINKPPLFQALEKGDRFSIDDGFAQFTVTGTGKAKGKNSSPCFSARAHDDYIIKNNKGLNLFGKDVDLPSLIEDDIEKLHLATTKRTDYVALSFVRTKQDVQTLKKELDAKGIQAQIVSKIESKKGLDNIDEIIEESDAIMIARGDLGVEIPIEEVAFHQKEIIKKCRKEHKPVIVATQMLQSMIENPIPTRAEASDVANAVFDGTDAVMLSGETATGLYPVQSVQAMERILSFNETKAKALEFDSLPDNPTELVVYAAEKMAELSLTNVKIDKILVLTQSGYTAKVISSFRPNTEILAVTNNQKTVEALTMSYGVEGIKVRFPHGKLFSPEFVIKQLEDLKLIKKGDDVLIIHGQHWQVPGQTNAVVLIKV